MMKMVVSHTGAGTTHTIQLNQLSYLDLLKYEYGSFIRIGLCLDQEPRNHPNGESGSGIANNNRLHLQQEISLNADRDSDSLIMITLQSIYNKICV